MPMRFDHTIFLAAGPDALENAAARFAARGFTVTARLDRDRDKAATAQKLVCFDDGSYIEILTIRDAAARARHRFAHLLGRGDGWADYSMVADRLDDYRERLAAAKLPVGGPHEHARELEDGRKWGVRLILAGIGAGHPVLPFILEDTMNRELRIPATQTRHANGAVGTAGVTLAVRDLTTAVAQMAVLFGEGSPSPETGEISGGMRFSFGSQWIDVQQAAPGTAWADHIARRGEGIVSVTFALAGGNAGEGLCLDDAALA